LLFDAISVSDSDGANQTRDKRPLEEKHKSGNSKSIFFYILRGFTFILANAFLKV